MCCRCLEAVEAQRAVWNLLGEWKAAQVSSDLDDRLFACRDTQTARWRDRLVDWVRFAWKPAIPILLTAATTLTLILVRDPDPLQRFRSRVNRRSPNPSRWLSDCGPCRPIERILSRLPPERREKVERRLQEYERLTPEQREKLHERYESFRQLLPQQQNAVRDTYRQFNDLPPPRKTEIRRELARWQNCSPEQRRNRMESEEIRGQFSPEERQILSDMGNLLFAPPRN